MWSPSRPTSNPPPPSKQRPGSPPMHGATPPITSKSPYNEPSTYIGKALLINGEVSGSEPIHIEGRIESAISMPGGHVGIGRNGMVVSTVHAGEVIVRGTLHGKLTASDRVEIHSSGSLIGDVSTGRISIEDGAYFQGKIDMRRPDPKAYLESMAMKGTRRSVRVRSMSLNSCRFQPLEPVSYMSQQQRDASEPDHAQEVLDVIFPAGDYYVSHNIVTKGITLPAAKTRIPASAGAAFAVVLGERDS